MEAQMFNYSVWVNNYNPTELFDYFMTELNNAGFGILDVIEKHFLPQGYTVLFLLSESHLAIHTFPEQGKSYIELTSCIDKPFNKLISKIIQDAI
jgi:S-adenosylmethionine decarboxylase